MRPRRLSSVRSLPLCLAIVVRPTVSNAQEVPEGYARLAETILDGTLRVGQTPAGFPTSIVPTDAELLGSAEGYRRATVVLVLPRSALEVDREMRQTLLRSGWTYTPRTRRGGFQDATMIGLPDSIADLDRPTNFCRGGEAMYVAVNSSGDGVEVHMRWEAAPHPFCVGRRASPASVPLLYGPPGMHLRGGGTSWGEISASANATAVTEFSPTEVIEHFAAQLIEAGWSVEEGDDTPGFASRTIRREDEAQGSWLGFRATVIPGAGILELDFHMVRPDGLHPDEVSL